VSTRRSFTWALPEWPQGTGCDPVYADSNSARPTKVCREFVQRPGRESLKLATPVRVRHSLPCFEIFQRVRLVAGPMALNHQATVRFGYPLPGVCSRRSTGQDTRLRTERFASSNLAASASFDRVAQRDSAVASEATGRVFESPHGHQICAVGAGWICTRLSTGTKRFRSPSAAPEL
jgi:hypothetical protein